MQLIQQALMTFFEQISKKDEKQMQSIKQEQRFLVEQQRWCFTLPDLHHFLQHHDRQFSHIEYKQFRQLIFSIPLNKTVKLYGAHITIADNQFKVDQSNYALVWEEMDNGCT